jgi:LysM repeat protein
VARTYGVVTGDTLPKLAERFYGDSTRFPLIAAANGIVNPALITAGQLLAIPEALGGVSIRREMINESIGRCILPHPVPASRRLVIETVTSHGRRQARRHQTRARSNVPTSQ